MADGKSALDMLDETIDSIERRQGYLKAKLNFEKDEVAQAQIKNELRDLDQQLSYTIDAKRTVEIELQKAKDEAEKKHLEDLLKASLFIGMMRERARYAMEYDLRRDKESETIEALQHQRLIDRAFGSMVLSFVTRDMIDDIMNDKEFDEMEKSDPHRLERKEADVKESYERAMDRYLSLQAVNTDMDFEQKQKKFGSVVSKKNGFIKAAEKILELVNSGLVQAYGDPEDVKFLRDIYNEAMLVGIETQKLYSKFATEESDFVKGNGFTKEIIEKENSIIRRLDYFNGSKLLPKFTSLADNNDPNAENYSRIYKAALEFIHPMYVQRDLDNVLYTNNELRKRMEMWKVRERLPKGGSLTKQQMQMAVDDEYKSWAKIERLKRMGAEMGGLDKTISEWSAECALKAFKMAKDVRDSERDPSIQKKKLSPEQQNEIKLNLAGMVLKQLIDIERKKPVDERYRHKELTKHGPRGAGLTYEELIKTRFDTMTKEIAKDPDFLRSYNKFMKDGTFTTRTIKFIAEDMDKKIARDLSKKPPVLERSGPVLQPNPYNE